MKHDQLHGTTLLEQHQTVLCLVLTRVGHGYGSGLIPDGLVLNFFMIGVKTVLMRDQTIFKRVPPA